MNEFPHRAVVDLETALGQLRNQPAQREVAYMASLHQPVPMRPRNRLGLVATHLTWDRAPGQTKPLHPLDGTAHRDAKPRRRLVTRHPLLLNRRNHSLA